jgi:hypothetical protein
MSRVMTLCAAICLWLSVAGFEEVNAKGGPISLYGPWSSSSAQKDANDAGPPVGYEAKSLFTPHGSKH